jgi:hypothetical protein
VTKSEALMAFILYIQRSSARYTDKFICGQCRLLLKSLLVNLLSALCQAAQ